MDPKAHRLPNHVRPKRYNIDISTDPERDRFEGSVQMDLEVLEQTDRVEMHAKGLSLTRAKVQIGDERRTAKIDVDAERELAIFMLDEPLPKGSTSLSVQFEGKPNPGMHGLYLAKDGAERAICTQCEATDARAIFPCFDEPAFKASLQWTIRTKAENIALANGPLKKVEEGPGGTKVWQFGETPPVSSYLAAICVGNFEGTDATLVGEIPVRVFAIRGKKSQARFAHGFTERLIPWYERYFGQPYPYFKYDQVAVPGFDAGAMENVGLVLFRQNLLLMDPKSASWNQEKLIAKVIAHELAHMWFGNLVTMQWWDDLWLNEAFAEWFAHKATHAIAPTYLVWNDFQSDKNRALVDDALPTTHAIWTQVDTPDQAIEMFDVITYQKGCAVMRMLENYLGEDTFRTGIRTYMKAFAEKNARGADLWSHLAEASKEPVAQMMGSWVEQPGFPVVQVQLQDNQLKLSQRRFFSSPAAAQAPSDQLWNVPVVVRYEDDDGQKTHRFILKGAEHTERLPASGAVRWCYANADEIGFYRVATHPETAKALLANAPTKLTAVEQMGLIEDQWAMVRNASNTLEDFMPVLDAFSKSQDHNVTRSLVDRLGTFDRLLELAGDEKTQGKLRARIVELFSGQLETLGFEPKEGEAQNELQQRALLIYAMANLARSQPHIDEAVRFAQKEREDPRSIDPNLAGTFVGIAAKFGDAERFDAWVQTYTSRKSSGASPQDSLRYLYTFAAFRPKELVGRTLGLLAEGKIPQEAVGTVISQLLGTLHGQAQAWQHLRDNWGPLQGQIGDMGISRVVEAVGALRYEHRQEIVDFFEKNPPAGAERALARALESMDQREELGKRIVPQLQAILR